MNPPLVTTTATLPVSAREGELKHVIARTGQLAQRKFGNPSHDRSFF
jgi:hypothetical protein